MNLVITGTSNGLGLELARWYLARDHRVVGLSRSASRVEHHRYRHFTIDVGNRSQVVAAASDCGLDTLDLVINNAGLPGTGRRIAEVAQNMLAVCLANELEDDGVAVEVLHPGAFQSACGRDDATDSPAVVAERIGAWLSSPPQELRLRETSGLVYDW